MIYNINQVIVVASAILRERNIEYVTLAVPTYKTSFGYKDKVTDVWVVSYTYLVFQEEIAFIYLDDLHELELIHIVTKHGYET